MSQPDRRAFLGDVGRGMLIASVGYATALDMGLSTAFADEGAEALTFGPLEPLVALMQETPAAKILPILVERMRQGTELGELVAAAALANARTFGGEDYIGFHTLMAMSPAYHMASELPAERRPLPILKVLYRNSRQIEAHGGRRSEVLHPVAPAVLEKEQSTSQAMREAVHRGDVKQAEQALMTSVARSPAEAFNELLQTVCEGAEVHRVVLAHRAWDMLNLVGQEQAATMLRQSLRYCVKNQGKGVDELPTMLSSLFDEFKLETVAPGSRLMEDAWVERMSQTIFESTPAQAAHAVAGALAEGIAPSVVAEAISVAANQLVLRDAGRTQHDVRADVPLGSVHGDSIGVHACDSANAWRNISRVSNPRNAKATLILAGYQVARDRRARGGDFLEWKPRPEAAQLAKTASLDADALLAELNDAIRQQDQERACAVVHRCGELAGDPRQVFDVLLGYAVSEDGSLHAEKFYRTTSDEFANTRPSLRWRQLVALARVTASEFGRPAPGIAEARDLLKV